MATARIVVDHFGDEIDSLTSLLDCSPEVQYRFMSGVIGGSEVKLQPHLAEKYLELLCDYASVDGVVAFLRTGTCRTDRALEIVRKNNQHAATALLLERAGQWHEALTLLLSNGMVDQAVELCVRGAEHIDTQGAQQLWLTLLRSGRSGSVALRQLLHAAAPHVPPPLLLELMSDANFGDVRSLLQGMLLDYQNDVDVLQTTFKILSRDLHSILAKSLSISRRAVGIDPVECKACGKSVVGRSGGERQSQVAVWACGHCFHGDCMEEKVGACPCCGVVGKQVQPLVERPSRTSVEAEKVRMRPDVEGHF